MIASRFSINMHKLTEELGKNENSRLEVSENNECVRLVIANEASPLESEILQPQDKSKSESSFKWWIKVSLWCIISIVFLLAFFKWGVPFLFEKVIHINYIAIFSVYNYLLAVLLKIELVPVIYF